MKQTIPLTWTLGMRPDRLTEPAEWIPARVPGAVQQDLARHLGLEPLYEKDHLRHLDVYEDMWAVYRAALPPEIEREGLVLEGKGIDYAYRICLNDTLLYENEGMFHPFSVALDRGWKENGNTLYITLLPPPKKAGASGRAQAVDSCKPPVCYGWDFHPRLLVRGIWDDLTLVRRNRPFWEAVRVQAELDETMREGRLLLDMTAAGDLEEGDGWRYAVLDPDRNPCAAGSGVFRHATGRCEVTLSAPRLWWPNEWGEQALYTVQITLFRGQEELDVFCVQRGFRRIRLIGEPGYVSEEVQEPQTRELPPITLEINGQPIFAKGTNWVCPTLFPGLLHEGLYRDQLEKIRDAHMNIVRCWGGAVVNKSVFFDLCDQMGLLVWQEFPLACNAYTDDPKYLAVLDRESSAILHRVRDHACLALWCGGNELFNGWSGMNDQSLALRLLNKNCFLHDPATPFIPTSPLMGMAHGTYVFCNDSGEDIMQIMNRMRYRAYPEFGCPGASSPELIHRMIPDAEWDHIRPGGSWERHHAVGSWSKRGWMMLPTIRRYFPDASTTERQIECSRFLQGVGYQNIFEEARRQAPHCTMALNWCFNEPWPTAANNSLISGDGSVKPAYERVCRALRASMVSVRFERFDHAKHTPLQTEVYLLMDRPFRVDGEIRLSVWQDGREITAACIPASVEKPELAVPVGRVSLTTDRLSGGLFEVKAEFCGRSAEKIGASSYDLLLVE